MNIQLIETLGLRIQNGGRTPGKILPWLGPALRGVVACTLRDQSCRHPPVLRHAQWLYCRGCPLMDGCAYGELYEPDLPPGVQPFRGRQEAPRAITAAPQFPAPTTSSEDVVVPLRLAFVGRRAVRHVPEYLASLEQSSRSLRWGRDQLAFDFVGRAVARAYELQPADLPESTRSAQGVIARLGVRLTSPLFLTERADPASNRPSQRETVVLAPSLDQLFRASIDLLEAFFACEKTPLLADVPNLRNAARGVPLIEHAFHPFQQFRDSSRSQVRTVNGVVGGGIYENVPLALLPWLEWGGRLGVGGDRVSGAGTWQLILG